MAFDWNATKKWVREHLEKKFLIIIRNEETFEETANYRLTLQNIYLLLSTLLLGLGIILFLLIAFSPIKRYVPGYGDLRSQTDFIKLEKKISSMEEELKARDTYIQSVQRILTGNPETTDDVTKNIQIKQEKPEPLPKVKEDSMLRAEFETNQALEARSKNQNKETRVQASPVSLKSSERENFTNLNFVSPIRGPLGAAYDPTKGHLGVDIIAPKNTPIKAILGGTVIQSDWSIENGHSIAIQHSNNLVSMYKHNSALLKKTGSRVKAGEAIAIIGNTGTLTNGPHLHFELWYKGQTVNPVEYIRF
ncbi:MAG TPA: M23 family metallopeptidase [Saprospiraceae bacterium]|nr:M23 family metallopeptidase [Saprospiraceae bacterium]